MSFLSDFEKRVGAVFGAAPQGYTEPFSFKKLARRAAREMERETYEIDGVDTAPALYTVLVSPQDDSIMRPLYQKLTYETSAFIAAQAHKKGYAFVGDPLVRFMVDPSLRSGKFAVFAENVDGRTLARLREEERAFLGESSLAGGVGGAAAQAYGRGQAKAPIDAQAHSKVVRSQAQSPLSLSTPSTSQATSQDVDSGLDVMPLEYAEPQPVASASASTPMPVAVASMPLVGEADRPATVPQAARRTAASVPSVDDPALEPAPVPRHAAHVAAPAVPSPAPALSAMLIDRQTGRTFPVQAPSCVIGRERSQCSIVLRDPNVSRRHAEVGHDGRDWFIRDLNSTNGTLVNDVDVDECVLRDGDLITIGLVNLEFRGNLR